MAARPPSAPVRRVTVEMAAAMAECAGPAAAYGKCMDLNLEKVTRGTCEAEFVAFKNCMQQAVRTLCPGAAGDGAPWANET